VLKRAAATLPFSLRSLPYNFAMNQYSCADILAGRAPADTPITLNGWVRTRRDSKAGLSFVHVSDGSGFHPV
jgi:asparaginyl-tRNA synthetase